MTMAGQIMEGIRVLDFLGGDKVRLWLERAKGEILEMGDFKLTEEARATKWGADGGCGGWLVSEVGGGGSSKWEYS